MPPSGGTHLLKIFDGMGTVSLIALIVILIVIFVLLIIIRLLGRPEKEKIRKPYVENDEDTLDPARNLPPTEETITIRAAVANNKGRIRGNNEDNFYLNGTFMARRKMDEGASVTSSSQDSVQMYAVCDGMGGTDCGEDASCRAVTELSARKQEHRQMVNPRELTSVLRAISDKINKDAVQKNQKSGTTIAMLAIADGQATLANVGDSRIYRFRGKKLTQVSVDHSRVQRMISMGILTPEQAKKDPGRHVITQYLGMPSDIKISPYIVPNEELRNNDVYLLCSDGLTDMVEDEQIEAILRAKDKPLEAVQELLKTALNNGGRDNVTVMVLRVMKDANAAGSLKKRSTKEMAIMVMQILTGAGILAVLADFIHYLI